MNSATRDESDLYRGTIEHSIIRVWTERICTFSPSQCWSPAVNVYRRERQMDVCVDLAGIERGSLEVQVEPGRLTVRGRRVAPEPERPAREAMRIIAMEIDHGPFSRDIALPEHVEIGRVTSNYEQGLLWIHLPLRVAG